MSLGPPAEGSPPRDVVAMCYVVAMASRRDGAAPGEVRVRFEFRRDLADTAERSESRTVLGVDAACAMLRDWLESVVASGG